MSLTADSRFVAAASSPRAVELKQVVLGLLLRCGHAVSRSIRIRLQRKLLRELPDYILKDIGISRGEVDAVGRMLVEAQDATRRQAWYL